MKQGKFVKTYCMSEYIDKDIERSPDDEEDLHHTLIINGKVYRGYDIYGTRTGTDDVKLAKKLQKKTKRTMEKDKLKELRKYIEILEGMVINTESITALSVFLMYFLRQISIGYYK